MGPELWGLGLGWGWDGVRAEQGLCLGFWLPDGLRGARLNEQGMFLH